MATFKVNTFVDENDGLSVGKVSLRDAITAANSSIGADTISFDTVISGKTITLSHGDLGIRDDLNIVGLGASNLTINGAQQSRIFNIDDQDVNKLIKVSIDGLKITGGSVLNSNRGGGILNLEDLTLTNSIVSGNNAGNGGGIGSNGILNVDNSTISDNSARFFGGGIDIFPRQFSVGVPTFRVNNSTVSGNSARDGGGLRNRGTGSVINTTISGNSATGVGGGFHNDGTASFTNSTISGNNATGVGGGINNLRSASLSNSTITLNKGSSGAGVANYSTLNSANTIISGNVGTDVDKVGTSPIILTSAGNNLVGTGDLAASFNHSADITGVTDPLLFPLANNGGPTRTHGLRSNSPAVNGGNNSLIPGGVTGDQRGNPRIVANRVDIGAVESSFTKAVPLVSLQATFAIAIEGGVQGVYRLSRTGDLSQALTVKLQAQSAPGLNSNDFSLNGVGGSFPNYSATIPAGQKFLDFKVTASSDNLTEAEENLVVKIITNANYQVNNNLAQDTVILADYSTALTVTNTQDSGNGSLRNAIKNANLIQGKDTITFAANMSGKKITLSSGQLNISDSVIIQGLGADKITIDAGNQSRVFELNDGKSTNSEITIEGLKITGGKIGNPGGTETGGGINNLENLTVNNTTITGNSAVLGGGAISNRGVLRVNDSTISGNSASSGGGIYNTGNATSTVNNTTISGNSANFGGGITNAGTFNLNNSTISANNAGTIGGGIVNNGTLTVNNSTISGNNATQTAGAIRNRGTVSLINSTISGNSATQTAGAISNGATVNLSSSTITRNRASSASGIVNFTNTTNVNSVNTIISGNLNTDIDQVGATLSKVTSSGNNLVGKGNLASQFNKSGDITNVSDPLLLPLANNGGPTFTHGLSANSLAVNAGNNALVTTGFDQRGSGFNRIVGGRVDIGAFESNIFTGTSAADSLRGSGGNDQLLGLAGNDTLQGTLGGLNQRDILTGGVGNDLFVLGTSASVFYGGDFNNGFAVIRDLAAGERIQLRKSASNYILIKTANLVGTAALDTAIATTNGDIIGVVQDNTSLLANTSSPFFSYV